MYVWQGTNAEDIEAEALADGLVDELIWEAVKAHMACQGQGPCSFILRKKSHRQTDHSHFLSSAPGKCNYFSSKSKMSAFRNQFASNNNPVSYLKVEDEDSESICEPTHTISQININLDIVFIN